MSYIGEANGFAKTARELAKKLREEGFKMSADERAKLVKDIEWYEDEARFCWAAARQEARQDEHDDAMDHATETYTEDTEDSDE